ncbi:hypothetical protein Ahy_B03g067445 [Arachis hypogaea]|uniref:FAR1 domain-containing protein n=1 Tax=Arachis hypogaea TaxID=3818 RepID=A0A445A6X5_ARAHY|nr:hypothetical protein Ahy_B03g067445 [Arachis hypogaea]
MNDSSSNHLSESNLDYSSESNQVNEYRCVVDERFVPKVGMTFKTLKEVGKLYKDFFKLAGFSTKIKNTTRKGDEIKNQLIICSREGKIYEHILKVVGLCIISKVVLNHLHPYCPAEMFKQHRDLSMFVRCTIENNAKARIRPSKTYQSFVAVAGGHLELSFIEKDV